MTVWLRGNDCGFAVALGFSYMAARNYGRGYRCCLRIGDPDCDCDLVALAQMTTAVAIVEA
jgi:hypothetical protein